MGTTYQKPHLHVRVVVKRPFSQHFVSGQRTDDKSGTLNPPIDTVEESSEGGEASGGSTAKFCSHFHQSGSILHKYGRVGPEESFLKPGLSLLFQNVFI